MLSHVFSAGNIAALPLALVGGVVAGLNPCCLALHPAAAAACCGAQQRQRQSQPAWNAIAFMLGVALAIAGLGVLAAYLGRVVVMASPVKYAIAALPIIMGVYQLGWMPRPSIAPKAFCPAWGGAFGTGLLLSLIIAPCGTPILASVLSFAAYQQNLTYGGLLLFVYGLGSALPVALVGSAAGAVLKRLDSTRFVHWIDPFVGSSLILLGFYLVWRV